MLANVAIDTQLRAIISGDPEILTQVARGSRRQLSWMYLLTQGGSSVFLRPRQNRLVDAGQYQIEIAYDASDATGAHQEFCGEMINVANSGQPANYFLDFIDPEIADLNCDGEVGVGDIGPFVLTLIGGYAEQYPDCDAARADIDCDGYVTVGDIGGFVSVIASL